MSPDVTAQVEYRIIRNGVVREVERGKVLKTDVCDAHPELLRAARNVGRATKEVCPICDDGRLVTVTFVFGAKLPPGGRCPGTAAELKALCRREEPVLCYEVEVCPACAWHHLMRKYPAGGRTPRQKPEEGGAGPVSDGPVTVPSLRTRKRRDGATPIVMVTAYDEPGARIVSEAGADIILVGDSVANNVLGYADTLHVDIDVMAHHTAAVARAEPHCLILGDMPWMSYHLSPDEAVRNAATLIRAGAQAVKLEGGRARLPVVEAIIRAEIPVMGHLGLTPQSVLSMGYRVQGKSADAASALLDAAKALAAAGCFGFVLEGVPDVLGAAVTDQLDVPTIGIGAGPACDGQVLVFHDLLGLGKSTPPKFVRQYADVGRIATEAIAAFADDVRTGNFPGDAETYHAPAGLGEALS